MKILLPLSATRRVYWHLFARRQRHRPARAAERRQNGGVATLATVAATLAITVWPQGPGGPASHRVVHCPGPAFCAKVTRAAFAPVPAGTMCSMVYGGPEQALVTGTIGGRKVSARFKRTNGCETARWNRLAFLFHA
jgi:hypothetical protein